MSSFADYSSVSKPQNAPVVRILALEGGGLRALVPALTLSYMEHFLGQPIASSVHMIAGSSTGALVAAGAATPDKKTDHPHLGKDLADFIKDNASSFYRKPLMSRIGLGNREKPYEIKPIQTMLQKLFDKHHLSDSLVDLMVPAFNLESGSLHFFKSWKAQGRNLRQSEQAEERDYSLVSVVRAAMTTPGYFEPAVVFNRKKQHAVLVDGGLYALNPALCALVSARKLYGENCRFEVISCGSGKAYDGANFVQARDWGLGDWIKESVGITEQASKDAVHYHIQALLPQADYWRLEPPLLNVIDTQDSFHPTSKLLSKVEKAVVDYYDGEGRDTFEGLVKHLQQNPKDTLDV